MYIVYGPPGTGKTTYLAAKAREFVAWARERTPEWPTAVLISSLTRAAAAEIAGRDLGIPRRQVSTLHSHAYRCIPQPDIAVAHIDEFNREHPAYALGGEGGSNIDDPKWVWGRTGPGDEFSSTYHALRAQCRPRDSWPGRVRGFARAWESWKKRNGYADFDDLIERAFEHVPYAPGAPSIIIADEAQDWSLLEYRLAKKWGRAAGHLIICGDPDQAIYTWRGADPEIFLDPDVPDEHRRVLGQSWRVPRAIQQMSMRWRALLSQAANIDYKPRDADGAVERCVSTWRAPDQAIALTERYVADGKTVMLVGTCGYMLKPVVTELRDRAIPFANPWRRKRRDWNPLAPGRGVSMVDRMLALVRILQGEQWSRADVHDWMVVMSSKLAGLKAEAKTRVAGHRNADDIIADWDWIRGLVEDDELQIALDFVWANNEAGLEQWWFDRLLKRRADTAEYPHRILQARGSDALRERPAVYVGTVHSFKGAEADVVILFPDLSPAGWRQWHGYGKGRDAVIRLFYVAMTRARERLIVCNPAGRSVPITQVMQ